MALVLVAEDNEVNLALMQYLLQAWGHQVQVARDGREALAVLRAGPLPDIVVCDVEMPHVDGPAFVQALRADAALAALPVLAVTSNAMAGDRDRLLAAGFDDYASKPIDPQHFVPWLEAHLRSGPAPQPPAPHATAPAPARTPPHGPLVLVVDDEPNNLELKRSCLEPRGYRVLTAASAQQGLALALAETPALIISDVGMREGDGFEFILQVKQQPALAAVPFIFVSNTHWDEISRAKGLSLGALRYLRRPLPVEELLAEVERALDQAGRERSQDASSADGMGGAV